MFVFRGRQGDLIKIIWWVSHWNAIGPSGNGANKGRMSVTPAASQTCAFIGTGIIPTNHGSAGQASRDHKTR